MSGLESIAMAVAHLEELQRPKPRSCSESIVKEQTNGIDLNAMAPQPSVPPSISCPPAPQSFQSEKTIRVVSSDSNSPSGEISTQNNLEDSYEQSQPGSNGSKALARVLADPAAWLHATQNQSNPANMPSPSMETVTQVLQDDVLCGRGGETNHHQGNIQYRSLVKAFQPLYIEAKRRDKPRIAQCIVYTVRSHGGRFLKRTDPRSNSWTDVGNTKAREKTSQALREGAPELRGTDGSKQPPQQSHAQASPSHVINAAPTAPPMPAAFALGGFAAANHHHHNIFHTLQCHAALASTLTPLQQAMSRRLMSCPISPPAPPASIPVVTPVSSFLGKRPSLVSSDSGDSSDHSHSSTTSISSSSPSGPRLKRLKLRLAEQQDSS